MWGIKTACCRLTTAFTLLIRQNLCPLSFLDVSDQVYIDAILGVCELKRIELLRGDFPLSMFMIVGFLVMVWMVMLVLGGNLRFMLMTMGGTIAFVGMVVVMLEGMGVIVVVVMSVSMLFIAMFVGMFVIVVMFVIVSMMVRVFSLAHGCLLKFDVLR